MGIMKLNEAKAAVKGLRKAWIEILKIAKMGGKMNLLWFYNIEAALAAIKVFRMEFANLLLFLKIWRPRISLPKRTIWARCHGIPSRTI